MLAEIALFLAGALVLSQIYGRAARLARSKCHWCGRYIGRTSSVTDHRNSITYHYECWIEHAELISRATGMRGGA